MGRENVQKALNRAGGYPSPADGVESCISDAIATEVRSMVDTLEGNLATLKAGIAHLRGSELEYRLHRRIRTLAIEALSLRRIRIVQSVMREPEQDFLECVEDAVESGRITSGQSDRIEATDLILHVQRRCDRVPMWVAVEVSRQVRADDVELARATADALRTVFDAEALAVVAGDSIEPPEAVRAKVAGVRYLAVPPLILA